MELLPASLSSRQTPEDIARAAQMNFDAIQGWALAVRNELNLLREHIGAHDDMFANTVENTGDAETDVELRGLSDDGSVVVEPGEEAETGEHFHNEDGTGYVSHFDLIDVDVDDHHEKIHAIDGEDHTGQLAHSALSGIGADDHHPQAHSHPLPFLMVTDFGADPTGEEESAQAVRDTIDALDGKGGIVFFPPGLYKISSQVDIPSNTRLTGVASVGTDQSMARRGTYIDARGMGVANQSGNPTQGCVFKLGDTSNSTIEHMKIEGSGPSDPPGSGSLGGTLWGYVGIFVRGRNHRIRDVTVTGVSSGIVIYSARDILLESVWVDHCWMVALADFGSSGGSYNQAIASHFGNSGMVDAANGGSVVALPAGDTPSKLVLTNCSIGASGQRSVWFHTVQDGGLFQCRVLVGNGAKGIVLGKEGEPWGEAPRENVTLAGVVVEPFQTSVQASNIEISDEYSDTVLEGVVTRTPNGGGDIIDEGVNTMKLAVNGVGYDGGGP